MAADGQTNREIAQALFVTAGTVETHLSSVYRKLDISARAIGSGTGVGANCVIEGKEWAAVATPAVVPRATRNVERRSYPV